MAAPEARNPTRKALEEMAPDNRTARSLELLFNQVKDLEATVKAHEVRIAAAEATILAEHP